MHLWYCVGLCRKSTLHVYSPEQPCQIRLICVAYVWYGTRYVWCGTIHINFGLPCVYTIVKTSFDISSPERKWTRVKNSPSSLALVTLCTPSTASRPPSDTLPGRQNLITNTRRRCKDQHVKRMLKYQLKLCPRAKYRDGNTKFRNRKTKYKNKNTKVDIEIQNIKIGIPNVAIEIPNI